MKKLLYLFLLIPILSFSQNNEEKKHIQFGFGYSLGFFNPDVINDYIYLRLHQQHLVMQEGTSDMFLNVGGRIFAGYKTDINLGFEVFLEGALGPKIIYAAYDDDMTFLFNRLSPGLKITYDIQVGRKSSIILGGGVMFNSLIFKENSDKLYFARSLGGKFSVAYQINFKHIAPRVFVDIDIAKAKDNGFELDYSGVQIGLAFSGIW